MPEMVKTPHVRLQETDMEGGARRAGDLLSASAREGVKDATSSFARQWHVISWPLRTALSCLLSSLVYLSPLDDNNNGPLEGRLLAPITASICSLALLGQTYKSGLYIVRGSTIGGLVGYMAIALLREGPGMGFNTWLLTLFQAVASMLLLFVRMPAVQHKLAWAIITIAIDSCLDQGARVDTMRPLKVMVCAQLGVLAALIVNTLPWPQSRASEMAATRIGKAERGAARAISCLSRILSTSGPSSAVDRTGGGCAAIYSRASLMAEAEEALVEAERACEATSRIVGDVSWELYGAEGDVEYSLKRARELTLAVGGMWLGALAILDSHDGVGGDVMLGITSLQDEEGVAGGVRWLKDLFEEKRAKDELFDMRLANSVVAVGMLIDSSFLLRSGEHRVELDKLDAAEKELGEELQKTREHLYYSAEREFADEYYKIFGPPMERFCFLFCLEECARISRQSREPLQRLPTWSNLVGKVQDGVADEGRAWLHGFEAAWGDLRRTALWLQVGGEWTVEQAAGSRWAYAAKLTASNMIALYIGILMTGSGLWAAVAVCFIGPRDSTRAGAGFRTGMLRVVGTVFGSMWGYTAAFVTQAEGQLGVWHLTILAVWVFIAGFVRANPLTAYGAQVSQFTPYIMIEAPLTSIGGVILNDGIPFGFSTWAWRRIQQNMIAVMAFMMIELLVLPTLSSALLLREIVSNLRQAAAITRAIFLAHSSALCPTCSLTTAQDGIRIMEAGLKRQREFLEEARDEAHWARGWAGQERLKACEALIELQSMQLTRLFSLMQAVIDLWSRWGDEEGKLAGILKSTRTAFLKLEERLASWLEGIADDVEKGKEAKRGLAAYESGEAVQRALRRFEACYRGVITSISKEFREGHNLRVPTNEAIVPLHAFIFCTRTLVKAVSLISKSARRLCDADVSSSSIPAAVSSSMAVLPVEGLVVALAALKEEEKGGVEGVCPFCSRTFLRKKSLQGSLY